MKMIKIVSLIILSLSLAVQSQEDQMQCYGSIKFLDPRVGLSFEAYYNLINSNNLCKTYIEPSFLLSEKIRYYLDGTDWVMMGRWIYNYDQNNNMDKKNWQYQIDSIWNDGTKFLYNYDNRNRKTEETEFLKEGSGYELTSKILYIYDENDKCTEHLHQLREWWSGKELEDQYWCFLKYDSTNKLIEHTGQKINSSKNWINNYAHTDYQYDLNDNLTSFIAQMWEDSEWKDFRKYSYLYDTRNKMIESYIFSLKEDNWDNAFQFLYTYDDYNYLIEQLDHFWDGSDWILIEKYEYIYNQPVGIEIEEFVSDNFNIFNNYPNPFNPSTTIKYSIPKQNNVTLKVVDVLGSEITTLVNKEQPQGNYEVEFDGSALTSGIYFYRIQSGDFVDTKKMILLK
jgi:Secretion system C-terminal sorting domain